MVTMRLVAVIGLLACLAPTQVTLTEDPIVYLRPSVFGQLPAAITGELVRRGCRIPQVPMLKKRHNVIHGEFAKPGQVDLAVLCSVKAVSSILVFWNASPVKPAVLAPVEDSRFLQGMANGRMGFSRAIDVATRTFILEHYKAYGGPKPPPIDHQGINDAFVEKASSVHYYYRGKWIGLQGAD